MMLHQMFKVVTKVLPSLARET